MDTKKDKSILILYKDEETNEKEAALALYRAISLCHEAVALNIKSYKDFLHSDMKVDNFLADLLIILNLDDSSVNNAAKFLRTLWAEMILKGYTKVPQVIIFSIDNIYKLVEQDPRHVVLWTEGVKVITIPFDLESVLNTIEIKIARDNIQFETAKKYLKWSCDLSEQLLTHELKNVESPYSLLIGACLSGEFSNRAKAYQDIENHLKILRKNMNKPELNIYRASTLVLHK